MSKIVYSSYVHVSIYVSENILFEGLTFTDNLQLSQWHYFHVPSIIFYDE